MRNQTPIILFAFSPVVLRYRLTWVLAVLLLSSSVAHAGVPRRELVRQATLEAEQLIAEGKALEAVGVLHAVLGWVNTEPDDFQSVGPSGEFLFEPPQEELNEYNRARLRLADALAEAGVPVLALVQYRYVDEPLASNQQVVDRYATALKGLPPATMRRSFAMFELTTYDDAYSDPQKDWMSTLGPESDVESLLARIDKNSPLHAYTRFLVGGRLIYRGIGADGDVDDFRRASQLIAYYPKKIERGLTILEAGTKLTIQERRAVAGDVAKGYAYISRLEDAVAPLSALAAPGDEGGYIRFRIAVARAIAEPCRDRKCAELIGFKELDVVAEVLYRHRCESKSVVRLADVVALARTLPAELEDSHRTKKRDGDVLAPEWPTRGNWQTRRAARRIGITRFTESNREERKEMQHIRDDFIALHSDAPKSPVVEMLTKELERLVVEAEERLRSSIHSNLSDANHFLERHFAEYDFPVEEHSKSLLFPDDILALELPIDDAVCVDYEPPGKLAAPPVRPVKGSSCAGCTSVTSGGGLLPFLTLLLAMRIRSRRDRRQPCCELEHLHAGQLNIRPSVTIDECGCIAITITD